MKLGSSFELLSLGLLVLTSQPLAESLGAWQKLAPMPRPRQEVGVAILEGKIYVVAGFDESAQSVNTVERYDPLTDTWESLPPLPAPEPLNHVGTAASDGHLFVIGGLRQDFSAVSSVFSFDPATGQWSEKANLPQARGALGVAVIDGLIYAAGGLPRTRNTQFTVYDAVADLWTVLPDMPTGRDHLAALELQGSFYAFSGRDSNVLKSANEVYDPASGMWAARAPVPTPRGGIAAAVLQGRAYVFGGEGNPAPGSNGVFREVEEYDPVTDSWRSMTTMPEGRHGIGAVSTQDRIFIPGGANAEGFGPTVRHDAFQPSGLTVTFDDTPFLDVLSGDFCGIDWGQFGWLTFGGTIGPCRGPLGISILRLAGLRLDGPSILASLDAGSQNAAGILFIISFDGSGIFLEWTQEIVDASSCRTLETNFTRPAEAILFFFSGGSFAVDNLSYAPLP